MPMLHDPAFRSSVEARLNALRPDSRGRWGKLTAGQMLWHVNQFLGASLGENSLPANRPPMPPSLFRFVLLYMPWPKSAPTNPGAVAKGEHDFETERSRCKELISRFANRPLDGEWPEDPTFGRVSGKWTSKLQAKHLDHHLKQFGT